MNSLDYVVLMLADLIDELDKEVRERRPGLYLTGSFDLTHSTIEGRCSISYTGSVGVLPGARGRFYLPPVTDELVEIAKETVSKEGESYNVSGMRDHPYRLLHVYRSGITAEQLLEEQIVVESLSGSEKITETRLTFQHNKHEEYASTRR